MKKTRSIKLYVTIVVIFIMSTICCGSNATKISVNDYNGYSANQIFKQLDLIKKNEKLVNSEMSIAVIDTGVYMHKDLYGNINCFVDFVNNKKKPYDDNGHGTNICGLIAGNGCSSNGEICGVLTKANLLVIKSLDEKGNGNYVDLYEGLKWICENSQKYNIKIVCLAWGYSCSVEEQQDLLYEIIQVIKEKGILVIAAAGNNENMLSPGILTNVLSVGSVNYQDDVNIFKISDFSHSPQIINYQEKPNIYLPGNKLITTSLCNSKAKYEVVSGTSYSAALAAGYALVLFEKWPNKNVNQIENILKKELDIIKITK